MNTTVIMVSFKSESLIFKNIENFPQNINIIIIDNSENFELKKKIEATYNNVIVILNKNNGFGQAANLGAKLAKTKYLLFCSPDNFVEREAVKKLDSMSNEIKDDFGLLVLSEESENIEKISKITKVSGIICFFTIKENFLKIKGFDENFFLYYEDNDLVQRFLLNDQNIFKVPIKYKNLMGSHNKEFNYPIELNRNWHLMWSKFYYEKKHHGYFYALIITLPIFVRAIVKIIIFTNNPNKRSSYLARASGLYNAYRLKSSWYRPYL